MTAPSCSIARAMALVLLAAAFVSPAFVSPARGEGALAVAIPDEGLHKGFAWAWKVRVATAEEARKEALQECKEAATRDKIPPGKCKVVEVFKKSCVAVATDAKRQWAGWGVGKDEAAARARAIRQCKVGGIVCAVADLDCDK
jgi:hypothetical protein